MDTAIGTFQADKKAAFSPKHGKIKPVDIFSLERRNINEKTLTNLEKALARDRNFLHPIVVRDEGATGYRLIAGHHRLQAWKRRCGEQAPIPAIIYPPHTPDALITMFEIEENLFRKELTAAERTAQEMRWVAAFKELHGWNPPTPVSDPGEAAESGKLIPILTRARRGRGNMGMAQQVADKFGIGKRAVNLRRQSAAAVLGGKIDFNRDTPEELERKAAELEEADKRRRAEAKVVRLKRRKPAPGAVTEGATPPAEPHAGEIDSQIEPWLKAFDTFGERYQFRLAYLVCIRLGLDPLKMAPPAVFGLDNEEPELAVGLPAEVAPATDDALPEQAEHGDEAAVAHAEEDDEAAAVQTNQGDNGAEFGAEDLQDAGDDVPDAADPEIGVTKCAHCKEPLASTDLPRKKFGRLYHRKNCVNYAKPIAIAA